MQMNYEKLSEIVEKVGIVNLLAQLSEICLDKANEFRDKSPDLERDYEIWGRTAIELDRSRRRIEKIEGI